MKRTVTAILMLVVLVPAGVSCRSQSATKVAKKGEKPIFTTLGQHILPEARLLELVCEVEVSDIPENAKQVQVWIPFPVTGEYQRLIQPAIESPTSYRPVVRYEDRYGTPVLFVSGEAPVPKQFAVTYTVRVERGRLNHYDVRLGREEAPELIREQFANELTPQNGVDEAELQKVVSGVATGEGATFERARAIYDYVLNTLDPDNATFVPAIEVEVSEGAGFDPDIGTVQVTPGLSGRSVKEVLVGRKGNVTDYALVTVALMRAAGIPARVHTGVLLGEDRTPDRTEVVGRHAWVRFYVSGFGWSACDPYLGDRHPELKDYMFRGLCANRVQLGAGPEPKLEPPPKTGLPTLLLDAMAEAGEKPVTAITRFRFRDVSGGPLP